MFISVLNMLRSFEEHRLQVIAGTNHEISDNPKAHSQEGQYCKCTIRGATSSPEYATSGVTSVSESHVNSVVRFPFSPPIFVLRFRALQSMDQRVQEDTGRDLLKSTPERSSQADLDGAGRGNRTPTGLLGPADFKSAASANFAIPAGSDNRSKRGRLLASLGTGVSCSKAECQFWCQVLPLACFQYYTAAEPPVADEQEQDARNAS